MAAAKATEQARTANAKVGENFIATTADAVEKLTKAKALAEAIKLNDNIDNNAFRLGGVLKRIHENSWFEDTHKTFAEYVEELFGFKLRKAQYFMTIYTELTHQQIPWEKISKLGWTKIKELAPILSIENVDEWVAKAENITVNELKLLIKGDSAGDDTASTKTQSDVKPMNFKLKLDQVDTVTAALAKAKAEVNTEYDNVALENICAQYIGNTSPVAAAPAVINQETLVAALKTMDIDTVLAGVGEAFPDLDLDVKV